ncbi:LuxR C-terminal-related transcriptional regulator [Symbiopectobacterium purcellii]|uniref:LuxR C-terminal-related transcriptional regulator n=1 Tax=Symbiopectobacterium purcellii TaxID=2871826 RepID=A0ABX9AK04_9ENTR|nr:LuxR C-terminal-related transcriptional regulator [Symbiopectobacterium purcellii]QZN95503.1 LuxR C-terminal-related transcriptional regulator [Symbiopectobacterium purcellii]
MVINNVLLFGQDSFFCKTISDLLLKKNIQHVHVKNYRQFFTQLVNDAPSLVIVTDDILDCERKIELFKIKCYSLGVRVLLFTEGCIDLSISKDLSVVDKRNSLHLYESIIDLFVAGYRLIDSKVAPDKKVNVQKVLSPRENTILSMMTGGVSVRDISKQLKIKEKKL